MQYLAPRAGFLFLGLLIVAGCNSSNLPDRQTISGTITLDGKPIEKGSVHFSSAQDIAEGTETFVDIIDGQYQAKVTLGKKRVSIRGLQEVRRQGTSMPPEFIETVPEKYNLKSELEADITNESERFDYDLKSK